MVALCSGDWLANRCDDELSVWRQVQTYHVLPTGKIERFSRLALLSFCFLFLALLGALSDGVKKSAFFFLQKILTLITRLLRAADSCAYSNAGSWKQ